MKRIIAFMALALFASVAMAQTVDPSASLGFGGKLMGKFVEVLNGFEAVIRPAALSLFVTLMSIEAAVWAYKQLINDSGELGALVMKFTWNIVIFGFFAWLIMNSHMLMTAIIQTFFKIGQNATGLGPLDAVSMLSLGVETALTIPAAADIGMMSMLDKPLVVLTAIIAEVLILVAFFVVAAQLVMAQVEAMIVIAAAPIILAFGALSYTRDIATKVLSHALGTGVKVLTIYILAGVMAKMGPEMSAVLKANGAQLMSSPGQLLEVIGIAGLMTLLAFFIPTVAGAMLSGQASMSGNSAITSTMGIAAGGAALGAAAIGGAQQAAGALASGATGAVAGAAGLTQALSAGLGSAADMGLSGGAAAGHALGQVAGHGMSMAASGIGEAVAGGGKAFGDKVASSTGGQIAQRIEAGRGGSISGASSTPTPAPSDSQSTGSAGSGSGSADSSSTGSSSTASGATGAAPAQSSAPSSSTSSTSASSSSATSAASLSGFVPSDAGNASGASISGGGEKPESPKTKIGSLAAATANALGSTHEILNRGKEQMIDDRATVGAAIDTKASH